MPVRHGAGPSQPGLVALGLALLLLVLVPTGSAAPLPGPTPAAPTRVASAICPGPSVPSAYLGSLLVQGGGGSPPGVAGRSFNVSYQFAQNFTPTGGSSLLLCRNGTATFTTNAFGGFNLSLPVPSSGCSPGGCTIYTGPFGPVGILLSGPTPAGFFLTESISGSTIALDLVAALDHVQLAPTSRVTLSTDAATEVNATAVAGNGAPTPATVGYAWRISGVNWSILSGAATPHVWIYPGPSAGAGSLVVWVNGTYQGTAVAAPPVTLLLDAAPTTIDRGSVYPTVLDVGIPVTFTVEGTGAAGYPYSAMVDPGLNGTPFSAPCTNSILQGGRWNLSCSGTFSYGHAGTATPTAALTNGYDAASFSFVPLTIASALQPSVTPDPLVVYVGTNASVTVRAGPATGTAPYGPACLWPGDGRLVCMGGAGPSYSFPVSYAVAGSYTGRATLADAGGANLSTPFSAVVCDRPNLTPISVPSNQVALGSVLNLTSRLSGGALPATYWWNTTAPSGTLYEGTAAADGPIVLAFVPHASGPTILQLSVRDALGGSSEALITVSVQAGAAVELVDRAPWANGSYIAGSPIPIDWVAVDLVGETVTAPARSLTLDLVAPNGSFTPPCWLNGSLGPLAPDPGGRYAVPAGLWHSGSLNLTLSVRAAGLWTLRVISPVPVADAPNGTRSLAVGPDLHHEQLVPLPRPAPPGAAPSSRSSAIPYGLVDRFGDPVASGWIVVQSVFDGVTSQRDSPVLWNGTAGTVWVNYTAPGPDAGTVYVLSQFAQALLAPIVIPAEAGPALTPLALVVAGGIAAVALAAGWWVISRRRSDRPDEGANDSEEALRRMAEGRAHVLGRAEGPDGRTLDELAEGFPGRPPSPEELTEWVASLVAEGAVRTVLGPDGRSRFVRVAAPEPLRVELDESALRSALDRRDAESTPPGPEHERPPGS